MTSLKPPGETEYEVWVNGCFRPPRVLLVVSGGAEGPFNVLDPAGGGATVFSAEEFLEVVDYLSEENYERASGRMTLEERDEGGEEDDDEDEWDDDDNE